MRPLPPSLSTPDTRRRNRRESLRTPTASRVSDAVARQQLLRDARGPLSRPSTRCAAPRRVAPPGCRHGRSGGPASSGLPPTAARGGAIGTSRLAPAAVYRRAAPRARERAQRVEGVVGDQTVPDQVPQRVDRFGRDSRRRPRREAGRRTTRRCDAQVFDESSRFAIRELAISLRADADVVAAAAAADDRRGTARRGRRVRRAARRRPRRLRRRP